MVYIGIKLWEKQVWSYLKKFFFWLNQLARELVQV